MPEETEKNTNAFEKIMDNEKSNVNGTIDDNDVIKNNHTNVEQATKLENCDVEENVHDIEQPHVSSQSDEMQNEHLNETVGVENHLDEEGKEQSSLSFAFTQFSRIIIALKTNVFVLDVVFDCQCFLVVCSLH